MRYYVPKFVATPGFFVFTIIVFFGLAGFYSQLQFVQDTTSTWRLTMGIALAMGTYMAVAICFAVLQLMINVCVYLKELLVDSLPQIRNYRLAPINCAQTQEYCYGKYFGCKALLFNGFRHDVKPTIPNSPSSFSSSPTAASRLDLV